MVSVQTVALSWQHSWELAAALGAVGTVAAPSASRAVRAAAAFARETAVIGVLYGLWQVAGTIAVTGTAGAFARARRIERVEHFLHLPSERSMQHLVLGHPLIVEGANYYYATMHFTTMLLFLLWMFVRHRHHYRRVRTVMAWTTLACLAVQLLPVAPPRMLPGVVDTGLRYHQSVYSNGLSVDQLSTMPSVHVAWAVLIGYYAWRISPSRWRYVAPFHAALMNWIVIVTGNHFWLDGIVAVALLISCAWTVAGFKAAWRAARTRGHSGQQLMLAAAPPVAAEP